MSVSKNRLLYFILIACILLSSCKQIIKKATTNTAKKAEIEVYEKGIRNTLNEVGSGPFKNMPWESIIRSFEKDNPILAIGLTKLSKKFQSSLSKRIANDPVLLEALLSSAAIKIYFEMRTCLFGLQRLIIWLVGLGKRILWKDYLY